MIMKKYCLFLFVLAFVACMNEREPVTSVGDSSLERFKDLKVFVPDTTLTAMDLVRKVAIDFSKRNSAVTRSGSSEKTIKEMIPVNGEDNEPLMYVFNYADDGGWVIVSGSMDYMPVLAHGEKGNFDMESVAGRPVELWLEQEKANIAHIDEAPDSIKEQYRIQWLKYAFKSVPWTEALPAMTRYDASDALAYQLACCEEWDAQGYDIYIIDAFRESTISGISTTLKNQIISDAYTYGTDIYDGVGFNSLVLIRSNHIDYVGPLVTTKWHQSSPYNDSIPNNYLVGCVPLAMAQIMRYHEYPTTFDWSNMPNSTSSHTTAAPIASLLKAVNVACNTVNGPDVSSATLPNCLSAWHNFGYTETDTIRHNGNELIVINELQNERPIQMWGWYDNNWNGGHSWVCSGYEKDYGDEIILKAMQESLNFYTVNYGSSPSHSFYMTWGWGGSHDGYFLYGATYNGYYSHNIYYMINIHS